MKRRKHPSVQESHRLQMSHALLCHPLTSSRVPRMVPLEHLHSKQAQRVRSTLRPRTFSRSTKKQSWSTVSYSRFAIWYGSSEESELCHPMLARTCRRIRQLTHLSQHRSETFNSFTTSTYTLAHLHTPTMYTFVILTDPVPPPSSIPSRNTEGYSIGNASAALSGRSSFGTGGGIPGTGGMSLKGVLLQIYRGPWVDSVVKNPLLRALEREERVVEPSEDADERSDAAKLEVVRESRLERTHGIDTDAFRESLEKGMPSQEARDPGCDLKPTSSDTLFLFIFITAHSSFAKQAFGTGIIVSYFQSRANRQAALFFFP
ncbi:hypothetical protein PHSY_000532 [Pseudozyma hubeiensis SY62]|uniref:Uncharacterized protein n=1 Tax=Pseudozyma hubeiensis (strain SY62) TaxID=1305764 RepID=R9NWV1_PSEHS|nr:hypothetical protein PHSY_000532 [Pseudozyma hubeiensis SY62]GAC92972.1 hypothetical protein PHSY_000532 [Pseudozyma hubeiensis SY62]